MNTNIYNDEIIVFKTNSVDALKAATEINNMLYVYVLIFDDVVLIAFDNEAEKPCVNRSLDNIIEKVTNILKKYNIEYKTKEMKF